MTSRGGRAAQAATGLLTAGIVLAACGSAESGSSGKDGDRSTDQPAEQRAYEEELEKLPGVDDARVEREAFDTDYWGEETVVDMVSDATADQLTAVLDSLTERARSDTPQESRVTLGAGDTDTAPDWYDADAPPFVVPANDGRTNAELAEVLVATAAALPDAGILVTESEWSVFVDSEEDDPRPAMEAAMAALRSDPILAERGDVGITVNPNLPTDARSASYNGDLDDASLRRWREVAEVMDDEVVTWVSLYGASGIGLRVAVPDDVEPRDLTTEAYGDVLWPVIRHEIDVLATFEAPAGLDVTNLSGFDGDYYREDRIIDLGLDERAHRDRYDRTWNAEAWAYLNR